jgi:two-component system nitrogen regulation response regulator GlnG
VRELGAVLQRAALDAAGGVIDVEHLPASLREQPRSSPASTTDALANLIESRLKLRNPNLHAATMAELERDLIQKVLERTAGNQSAAAAMLGITRSSLRFKIRTLGIDVTQFLPQPDPKPGSSPPHQLPPVP